MDNVLLYFALKYQGNWEQIYTALDKKEKIDHDDFVQLTSSINANFISIINPLYPSSLKNAHKPPFVLFAEGDLNLLTNYHQIICLSGDETFNDYGEKVTDFLVENLQKENRILLLSDESGIEHQAIEKAIELKTKIIIVTQKGLSDYIDHNPKLIELIRSTTYLIISESYFDPINPESDSLEYFSRLKAGIAKAFIIVQAKMKSKCMNVVNYALNDGKDIFAIPENIYSEYKGNNFLIKQGAKLIESANDVLNEI